MRANLGHLLQKYQPPDWQLYQETPVGRLGLRLQPVATTLVEQAGRDPHTTEPTCSLSSLQPDFVLISHQRRKIALGPEISRPSDSVPTQLHASYNRKIEKYYPLLFALQDYIQSGWTVRILPWIVGVRGLASTPHLEAALDFLDIPPSNWPTIINSNIQSSIEALAFMHRIRFSTRNQCSVFDKDDPRPNASTSERALSVGKKRKTPICADDFQFLQKRWKLLTTPLPRRGAAAAQRPPLPHPPGPR